MDPVQEGVYDSFRVLRNCIASSAGIASNLLLCDEMLKARQMHTSRSPNKILEIALRRKMLRFRRYRVFLIFAAFVIAVLYHFTSVREWDTPASSINVDSLKKFGIKGTTTSPETTTKITQETKPPAVQNTEVEATPSLPATPIVTPPVAAAKELVQEVPPTTTLNNALTTTKASSEAIKQAHSTAAENLVEQGQGRMEVYDVGTTMHPIHWTKLPEHFPVPPESVIQLPTGRPKSIPKIQHTFTDESSNSKIDRERKLAIIKESFRHAWDGYREYAWLQDELSPVSGKYRNPFCGWAATLVDSLDTLWIMGMKEDFEQAVNAVTKIDFTTSIRNDIPLFETTIRYLGGLVAAYDISEARYRILLDKAVELAEVLMGAFDTPNRMPMTFYQWKPTFASQAHRAGTRVVLSEIGSLSVEFTRLAQITKDSKYYDAIARITNEFEIWQNSTKLPGMWPVYVDASGCKKPERTVTTPVEYPHRNKVQIPTVPEFLQPNGPPAGLPKRPIAETQAGKIPTLESASSTPETLAPEIPRIQNWKETGDDAVTPVSAPASTKPESAGLGKAEIQHWGDPADEAMSGKKAGHQLGFSASNEVSSLKGKRQLMDATLSNSSREYITEDPATPSVTVETLEEDCIPQGLASPPQSPSESFTLGGLSDSLYEYLPKEYMLLGGLNEQYRTMYESSIEVVKERLLFRPVIPNGRNILISGSVTTDGLIDKPDALKLRAEGSHLTCFVGGMLAVGAKIFNRKEDIDIAAKLTDGCIWAYESTTTGIMPETFNVMACQDEDYCPWNETAWWDALDENRMFRDDQRDKLALLSEMAQTQEVPPSQESPLPQAVSEMNTISHPLSKRKRYLGDVEPSATEVYRAAGELKALPSNVEESPAQANLPALQMTTSRMPQSIYTPPPILTHEEYVKERIQKEVLPPGYTGISSRKYILRPEAIESVFIMYRTTGEEYWREKGWQMFAAIQNYTLTELGNSAISDVTSSSPVALDEMESFWLAETLKYFFLLFSDPEVVSLDDYVL
ncbi:MAG: hypothetical protein M1827_000047 [Pycnora praestabilis]|nr:MAG: hypothetical protein M1827_000047 [Pycnora praestabilis]